MRLHQLVERRAEGTPHSPAVKGPDGTLTYRELDKLANQIARCLSSCGVRRGDRVAFWLNKSTKAVATMQAILKLGGIYVPLDPRSPASRVTTILGDCGVSALVSDNARLEALQSASRLTIPVLIADGMADKGKSWSDLQSYASDSLDDLDSNAQELAYILYTSGSTGTPKGVCISHGNALAFVEWAVSELDTSDADRFANHAPFHFDLSVLDIYAAFWSGASVHLVPEGLSYVGQKLVKFIQDEKITIWYSVPTAIMLMMDSGNFSEKDLGHLRAILFAGEVFPIKQLRSLRQAFPNVRLLNLYGPTETNVCTFYDVRKIPPDQGKPVPIGRACCGDKVWAVRSDGSVAKEGEEGELWVEGPTVMLGYWGKKPQAKAPYATGDIAILLPDGNYDYVGRRDHQVKVRGFRIELGEIEAALLRHPQIKETAVVVVGEGATARLVAFVIVSDGKPPSLLAFKKHCAAWLPHYMIVDRTQTVSALPHTPNGKVDRLKLKQMAETTR